MALMPEGRQPREDVEARFMVAADSRPTHEQVDTQIYLRRLIADAAVHANRNIEDSREKSLGLTALEDGLMWLGKAIFRPGAGS